MSFFETDKLPFPFDRGARLAGTIGRLASERLINHSGALDNMVDIERDKIQADIENKIAEFSLRRPDTVIAKDPGAAQKEAAEQAALPELQALQEYIGLYGAHSYEEAETTPLQGPPDPFAARLIMHALSRHERDLYPPAEA